VKEHSP